MDYGIERNLDQSENITLEAMKNVAANNLQELGAEQLTSESELQSQLTEIVAFPGLRKKETPIKAQKSRVQKSFQTDDKGKKIFPIEFLKKMAGQFEKRNPELRANVLVMLRESIKPGDSKEEILRKVLEFYSDVSLADEALEYLFNTTDGELAKTINEVREELHQEHGREIIAGRNINTQARQAAEKGLGTPTSMRDMYRDITGNPREAPTLFDELSKKYAFKDLKKIIDFFLHSLGTDMKSKGPSIDPGELHRLFSETRTLQAILGVYRFFKGRMNLINSLFIKNNIPLPHEFSFELLSKEFMALCAERYPSSDKVLQKAVKLGLEHLLAKIIALSQYRDAIREVALNKIYKTLQHRDDLYLAILEALEDLEDDLEEEDSVDEKEKEVEVNKTKGL